MLVLKVSIEERVLIKCPDGSIIWVKLLERTSFGGARLGFDAPKEYKILREELLVDEKDTIDDNPNFS